MRRVLLRVALLALSTSGARAANVAEILPGYTLGGSITSGYRIVDVDGSQARYRDDYDLHDGPRLLSLLADGRALDAATSRLDRVHLEVLTPGPEPVQQYRLSLADQQHWDLRVRFTRSRFFYAVPALWEGGVAGDVRTDDLHDWNFVRTRGAIDFTFHPTGFPTLFAGYQLQRRDGRSISTVLAPVGETFQVNAPVDDVTHVGRLGTAFVLAGTDVFVQQEYRRIDRSLLLDGAVDPAGVDPADGDRLDRLVRPENEHLDIPATTLRLRRPIGERVELGGGYYFSHAALDGSWRLDERGTAPDPAAWPPVQAQSGVDGTLDTQVVDAGVIAGLTEQLRLDVDYRWDARTQDGHLAATSTFGPLAARTADQLRVQRVTTLLAWEPRPTLELRAGIRYAHQTAHFTASDIDQATNTIGPVASARYRPWSLLDLSLRYEHTHIDDPIQVPGDPDNVPALPARDITLTTRNRGTLGVMLRPWQAWSARYQLVGEQATNDQFNGRTISVANSATVAFVPTPALTVSATYARRDLASRADILVAPLYATSRSVQSGAEDVFQTSLHYDLTLWTQPWTVGWDVAWVRSGSELRPRLEAGGTGGITRYDLARLDAGASLAWRHRWLEPAIEVRLVDYTEPMLTRNDYRATIITVKLTRRFGTP